MSWFKIDDGFADHPKVVGLQDHDGWKGALALWTLAGSWCSRQLTDGHVPAGIVRRLGCSREDAALLVEAGLWLEVEGGYQYHDWGDYNPTRASVEERREKGREKLRRWREARRNQAAEGPGDVECNQVTPELREACNQVTHRVSNQVGNPAPDPTRPDPTRPVVKTPIPPTAPEPEPSAAPSEPPSRGKPRLPVSEVFDYWRVKLGKSAATKLDARRRRRIEWALREYGLEQVKRCIDGYATSAWHLGENDRGMRYDDLTLWLRSAEHVERGLAMAEAGGLPMRGALPPAQIDPDAAAESQRAARELFGELPEVCHG